MPKAFAEFVRNFKPNTASKFLAWLLFVKPILQYVFDFINAVSNLDFALSARGNPRMIAVWNFLNSPPGNICFSAVGLLWLLYFGWRWSKTAERPEPKFVEASDAADNSPETRIKNLTARHESEVKTLQEEMASLREQHADEIDGRKRAFEALRVKHDTLQERIEAWEKYTWLVGIAETQAEHIDQYVILDRIERGDIQLNDGVPFVKFGIWIANNSLFAVTLELESGGYVVFREQRLAYPVSVVSSNYVSAGRYREAHIGLVIEQRLSREEAFYISSSEAREDAMFYLDRLTLTIKGERKHPPVEPKPLHINKGVTLHGESRTLSR